MIARMDLKKALKYIEGYDDKNVMLLAQRVDPMGATFVSDGYALKAVFEYLRLDPTVRDVPKLDKSQMRLIEVIADAFLVGGATFIRACDEVAAAQNTNHRRT